MSLAGMVMIRFLEKTLEAKIADIEELRVDLNQAMRATLRSRIFCPTLRYPKND
jgi:hypothetical protein